MCIKKFLSKNLIILLIIRILTYIYHYINKGYLTHEIDLLVLVEGIKLSRKLVKMAAFQKYIGPEIYPGENVQSDDDLKEYIRQVAII